MLLPPDRCTLYGTGEEVEDGTDGTYVTMDVQLIPMRVRPLLLLWRRHANPEQIRVGSIDGINDSLVVLITILILHNQGTKAAQVHPTFLNPHLPQAVPARTNLAQTALVRHPYSVAVLSTRGRLHSLSSGKREAW